MTRLRLPLWFLVANWIIVLAAFALGVTLARRSPLPDPQATALGLVYRQILDSYVDAQDPAKLLDRGIAAMAGLDDYSEYVPAENVPQFVEETTGNYDGIGIWPYLGSDGLFVRVALAGGPADRAGLAPGDRIAAIDDVEVSTTAAATERLRGPVGTSVRLRIVRGDAERTVTVARASVQRASVKWSQVLDAEHGIAYLHLADFHPGCAREFEHALGELSTGRELRGLVVDLRGDRGGNLDECVAIARLFLRAGNIVTLRRRSSEVVERFDAEPSACRHPDLPLALLVNHDTASASEVLAGALQDHRRAVVVGTETYGKGCVNTLYEWRNLDFRLKLTTAVYFTPNGRNLERDRWRNMRSRGDAPAAAEAHGGIAPDRPVALDERQEKQVAAALAGHPVPEHQREALREWSRARNLRFPGILGADEDPQLAAALAVLREPPTDGPTDGAANHK